MPPKTLPLASAREGCLIVASAAALWHCSVVIWRTFLLAHSGIEASKTHSLPGRALELLFGGSELPQTTHGLVFAVIDMEVESGRVV